jgi:nucleoid-associated protein YgaU
MFRCLIFTIIAALLGSCAKPPYQELEAAEYMVGRAYAIQAMEFAPTEYQAAEAALSDARKSLQQNDYGNALDSIEFSLKHSRRAVVLTEEKKAKRAAQEARRALEEEKARQNIQEEIPAQKAAPQAKAPPAAQPPPKTEPKPKVTPVSTYIVGEGETLWTISAQPQVYNEGLLWPLLYRANRDQIKDPRQIFPGQALSIRRDMTEKDIEEARQKARESDIFPVTTGASPTQ